MSDHVVTLHGPISYPGGKNGSYYTTCSCGKYRSGAHFYPGHAEAAARQHVESKAVRDAD